MNHRVGDQFSNSPFWVHRHFSTQCISEDLVLRQLIVDVGDELLKTHGVALDLKPLALGVDSVVGFVANDPKGLSCQPIKLRELLSEEQSAKIGDVEVIGA